jgi:hypothetical protein
MSNNTGMGWTVVKAPSGTGTFGLSGACFIGSTASQTRRDNLTGFSDFATVQSQNPLPIELLSFDAEAAGEDVVCQWSTASEINNDYFLLERSADAETFVPVVKVNGYGAGVSNQVLSYRHVDEGICYGTVYYRLKQVDLDGAFTYSHTVAVKCLDAIGKIAVFPNPVLEKLTLTGSPLIGAAIKISVYNVIGDKVMEKNFLVDPSQKSTSLEIDVQTLPTGLYHIEVVSAEEVFRTRFVKR